MESRMNGFEPKREGEESPLTPKNTGTPAESEITEVNEEEDVKTPKENGLNELTPFNPLNQNMSASNLCGSGRRPIGAFTVQCATCFKWRLIPTKEMYEKIREKILQTPFVCENACEWRPDITCKDPEDISQDGSRVWAIDKPNIPQPPLGWKRDINIRAEGGTRFADVYYTSPTGKRMRSMVEIQKHLAEHPEFVKQGVNPSQFSFLIPKPLQEDYVKKRHSPRLLGPGDAHQAVPLNLEAEEVMPLSFVPPTEEGGVKEEQNEPPPVEVESPVDDVINVCGSHQMR